MKKRLNNKGYMLVEIILASAIAMGVAYFIIDLTIKLKNKNDDLLVKTLTYTDQAIIYNTLMKDIYNPNVGFDCNNITITNNEFKYNGFRNIINEYATPKIIWCSYNPYNGEIQIDIELEVPQINEDFNVNIKAIKA